MMGEGDVPENVDLFGIGVPLWVLQVLLAGVISPLLIGIFRKQFEKLGAFIVAALKTIWAALRALPAFLRLRHHVLANKPLWSFRKARRMQSSASPPTLTVMNFKGGVGKTTIAANLAASFAKKHGLRVLLIDLDYQGSLSDILRPRTASEEEKDLLSKWLKAKQPKGEFDNWSTEAVDIPDARLVTSEYSLTETEDNQLLRWLLGETGDDVRSRLGRKLKHREWSLSQRFDLVILDAPPRLSVASANALKATDYVLVPTKLQPLSSAPIFKMLAYLAQFRERANAKFKVLGVVCNMTQGVTASSTEDQYLKQIKDALAEHSDNPRILEQYIPDWKDIGRPTGTYVGYNLSGQAGLKVQNVFDALAEEVGEAMGFLDEKRMAAE